MVVDWIELTVLSVQDCHAHRDGQAYDDLGDWTQFVQPGPENPAYGIDMLHDCLEIIS